MARPPVEGFAATTQWRVLTIESDNGDRGTTMNARDEAAAREHYAWLTRAHKGLIVILEARAADGDDWITIERHP
jgi:hypothetical protein